MNATTPTPLPSLAAQIQGFATRPNRLLPALFLSLVAAGSAGCGGDDALDREEHEDPAQEACEHAEEGPFETVQAGRELGGAVNIFVPHTSVALELNAEGDRFSGWALFDVAEGDGLHVFLSHDVGFEVSDYRGMRHAPVASSPVELCTIVAVEHTFELEVGSYLVHFDQVAEPTVSFVIEEAHQEEE